MFFITHPITFQQGLKLCIFKGWAVWVTSKYGSKKLRWWRPKCQTRGFKLMGDVMEATTIIINSLSSIYQSLSSLFAAFCCFLLLHPNWRFFLTLFVLLRGISNISYSKLWFFTLNQQFCVIRFFTYHTLSNPGTSYTTDLAVTPQQI